MQVTGMISAAKDYIRSAVGEYDAENQKAFVLLCAMVQDFYDQRELMQSEQQLKRRMTYVYQSIILQLQIEYELKQEERNA